MANQEFIVAQNIRLAPSSRAKIHYKMTPAYFSLASVGKVKISMHGQDLIKFEYDNTGLLDVSLFLTENKKTYILCF